VKALAYLSIPVLPFALLLTPLLLTAAAAPRLRLSMLLCVGGVLSLFLNMAVPVALHLLAVPIDAVRLGLVHAVLALIAVLAARAAGANRRTGRRGPRPPQHALKDWLRARAGADAAPVLLLCGGFALAVVPLTGLAGVDTYKWLDLATSVRVERAVPWLVHPLSLLGFTGRSYPSAQPLLMATVMILGHAGVEVSYYVVSVFSGGLGILAMHELGAAFLGAGRGGRWAAFLYGFSPVFVRYNHWATGRGLFLAVLPLLLLALLRCPAGRACLSAAALAALLPLTHKTGIVALPLVGASLLLAPVLRPPFERAAVPVLAGLSAALALALAPRLGPLPWGPAAGFVRTGVTRFGWLLPLAGAGLLLGRGWFAPRNRRLFAAALLSVPLAFPPSMYGALIALPFVALAAGKGVAALQNRVPIRSVTIALTLCGALAILVNRSITATPPRIRAAARFLEQHDPEGPYRVVSPAWQAQIQGYVSGCPRFTVRSTGNSHAYFAAPPPLSRHPARLFRGLVAYSRHAFGVAGVNVAYYGRNPRYYFFTIDGAGRKPADAVTIYNEDGIAIHAPAGQPRPAEQAPARRGIRP